jgi:hypothetical protein
LKNARERTDMLAAYREVGSYRGAAAMCGTTHKTVRRVVGAALCGRFGPKSRRALARTTPHAGSGNLRHLGRCSAERGLASGAGRTGPGASGRAGCPRLGVRGAVPYRRRLLS